MAVTQEQSGEPLKREVKMELDIKEYQKFLRDRIRSKNKGKKTEYGWVTIFIAWMIILDTVAISIILWRFALSA